jgi:UTP--glucose-1-phosphate uridylyltransferase
LAVQEVPLDQVSRYGIIAGPSTAQGCTRVERMVEKPQPAQAPSRLAVAGRYILSPAVFECIRQGGRGVGGEIQLTDGIAGLLHSETVLGYNYRGKRYDCGSKLGFLEATVELALQHSEVGPGFSQWLKQAGLGR